MAIWTVIIKTTEGYEAHVLYSSFDQKPAWQEAEQTYLCEVVAMWKGNYAEEVMMTDPNKSENKLTNL
jgi:hypothetical protein